MSYVLNGFQKASKNPAIERIHSFQRQLDEELSLLNKNCNPFAATSEQKDYQPFFKANHSEDSTVIEQGIAPKSNPNQLNFSLSDYCATVRYKKNDGKVQFVLGNRKPEEAVKTNRIPSALNKIGEMCFKSLPPETQFEINKKLQKEDLSNG
ncbi:MAG: hypothetical protein K9G62_08535 [Alphaproteobacteria bacterium]|nr:hypothetical protein [Alphaproteobacteria bacterium]